MIFVAHLSFELNPPDTFTRGHMTAVAQAPDIADALEKFQALLNDPKTREVLSPATRIVFMDSVSELGVIPEAGLITYYALHSNDGVCLNASNIGADEGGSVRSCRVGVQDGTDDVEPFVTFVD